MYFETLGKYTLLIPKGIFFCCKVSDDEGA